MSGLFDMDPRILNVECLFQVPIQPEKVARHVTGNAWKLLPAMTDNAH
jgi:hypothetical protein